MFKFGANRLALGIGAAMLTNAALAQPAPTRQNVENTARTIYNSGSAGHDVPSNSLSIPVDELIDVSLTNMTPVAGIVGNDPVAGHFQVVNAGRGPEAFIIRVNPDVGSGRFTPVIKAIMIDSNGNGAPDTGIDTVMANGGTTPELLPNQQIDIFVMASLPPEAVDRTVGTFNISATAATGSGVPGTVITARGTNGADAIVGLTRAQSAAAVSLTAALASVTTVKSSTILDPLGGTRAVSGSRISFRLVATATGSGSARDVRVVDAIPAGTSYVSGSLMMDGTPLSDAADGDAGTFAANAIEVAFATINGGERRAVSFSVIID